MKQSVELAKTGETVKTDMKIAILHTIAKSIYTSPTIKIREAVANSKDNKATTFLIFLDASTRRLSLFDDGNGISKKRFEQIFNSLGYGLYKNAPDRLSYFGLGLMAIFRLGAKATIFTRERGESDILSLSVETANIFDEDNQDKSISLLSDFMHLTSANMVDREGKSPLTEDRVKGVMGEFPSSFTEIVIEDVVERDLDFLTGENCIEELRKFLPLKTEGKEPFIALMQNPEVKKKIEEILADPDYCPTIDVYFGIEEERELTQLWKYYPEGFKDTLRFAESNILAGKTDKFAYYIVFTTEDLEPRGKENAETGFWVRNQNFLVKPADFFQRPGFKKRIIHEPLSNWMFGEIFHKDMNDFIVVPRNDYVWDSPGFNEFRSQVEDVVKELNRTLRDAWKYGNQVAKMVVNPFEEAGEPKGPFYKVSDRLSKIGLLSDSSAIEGILTKLGKRRNTRIENEAHTIDKLASKGVDPIVLADNENCFVTVDQSIKYQTYEKGIEPNTNRAVIKISPSLFSSKKVTFLGKTFEVFFVAGVDNDPGVSINEVDRKIYVNPFNQDIMNYSISFLDVYIALEIADLLSDDKAQMKYYLLKLLGADLKGSATYLGPLGDDLQRKKRS